MLVPTLVILVTLAFAVPQAAEQRARQRVLHDLDSLSAAYRVVLNNEEVSDGTEIVAAVMRVRHINAHHSGPMVPITVQIGDGPRVVRLIIARDSKNPDEYWMFRPGDNILGDPLGQELGRVVDPSLTAYFSRHGL